MIRVDDQAGTGVEDTRSHRAQQQAAVYQMREQASRHEAIGKDNCQRCRVSLGRQGLEELLRVGADLHHRRHVIEIALNGEVAKRETLYSHSGRKINEPLLPISRAYSNETPIHTVESK